jgi:lysophospholipid acyltransferase (LPLAT)-like uncharacterized protein
MSAERAPVRHRARGLRRNPRVAEAEVAALAWLLWALLRMLRWTLRLQTEGADELMACWRARRPVVVTFWHGRALMLPYFYRGGGATIMNSTHRDGEIVTRALARFGIESTRGSSSRGAVAGALGLLRAFARGRDLALIPDGPRGPAAEVKPGVVEIARQTGALLFPVALSASRCARGTGWDRLMIPAPGARVAMVVGSPILAGEEQGAVRRDRERRGELCAELQAALVAATRRADELVGREPEDF